MILIMELLLILLILFVILYFFTSTFIYNENTYVESDLDNNKYLIRRGKKNTNYLKK